MIISETVDAVGVWAVAKSVDFMSFTHLFRFDYSANYHFIDLSFKRNWNLSKCAGEGLSSKELNRRFIPERLLTLTINATVLFSIFKSYWIIFLSDIKNVNLKVPNLIAILIEALKVK